MDTPDPLKEAKHALSIAKIHLISMPDTVFFSTVCLSLKFVWDETIDTAEVNATTMYINPAFFVGLSPQERVFVLAHEVLHVALMHMLRGQGKCPDKYNQAADHCINLLLLARHFKMPDWVLKDPKYTGMSTDEIYALLPEPNPDNKSRKMGQDIKPDGAESKEAQAKVEQVIQDILIQAAIHSKLANNTPGSIPGDIQIYLDNLLSPKLPWHRILQKYLYATTKSDYSFRKPNRRFFPKQYLPSLHSECLTDIAIAVDASGSVSNEDFKIFISEIKGIFRMMKPEKITLIQFDTKITHVDVVRNVLELAKVKFSGKGGTDIEPILEWANINKPQLLLTFTDGEFRFSEKKTKIPMLWLIHNNKEFTAPFGKVIHYSI